MTVCRQELHSEQKFGEKPVWHASPASDHLAIAWGFLFFGGKVTRRIELGLLYSRSGSYSLISEACRTGALAAIALVNADPDA